MRLDTLVMVLALVLSSAANSGTNAAEMRAEVIHWWTSRSESAAVKVLADQFAKAGGIWVDSAVAGSPNARATAINRIVGGAPPTAMQFSTGKSFDDLVENDLLNDMDAVAQAEGWSRVVHPIYLEAVSRNGKIFAVPVNIHGSNWLWFNRSVLEKAGATAPTNFDNLFQALDKIKAVGLVPLAFSGQKNWESSLFYTTIVAKGGRNLYLDVVGKLDVAAARSSRFLEVAKSYGKLRAYIDAGSPGRNWNDAMSMVLTGKAGMQFMGDWAKGEIVAAGKIPGEEIGCNIFGADDAYIMSGDVFVFPRQKSPDQVKAQRVLARVILDKETQFKFAEKKGSLPVRSDVDVSSLDVCARTAQKVVSDPGRHLPTPDFLISPSVAGALDDIISNYWNTPGMKPEVFVEQFAKTIVDAM